MMVLKINITLINDQLIIEDDIFILRKCTDHIKPGSQLIIDNLAVQRVMPHTPSGCIIHFKKIKDIVAGHHKRDAAIAV